MDFFLFLKNLINKKNIFHLYEKIKLKKKCLIFNKIYQKVYLL